MSIPKRILLLTGQMAYDDLIKIASAHPNAYVEALPISVAAFTTARLVQRHGPRLVSKWQPELIIISGMAQDDFSDIGTQIGVPVLKGPRNLSGLSILLNNIEEMAPQLSSIDHADFIIREQLNEFLKNRIQQLESDVLFDGRNFKLRSGLSIGIDLPPRLMAEIVDATIRPVENSLEKARIFSRWASIIDIGATIQKPNPERIAEMVSEVYKLGLPVSIDTLDEKEILAGVDAGAEIILSIDKSNFDVVQRIPEDVALVILPTNVSQGFFPRDPRERAKICHEMCTKLRKQGYEKILADPLLEAPIKPGLMQSLSSYLYCRELGNNLPFLAGFANVTEFIDADSSGMNALLACIGVELGISVFLSTEERASTIHSTRELESAIKMAIAAKIMNSTPKEIGFSSFAAKSGCFDPQPVSGKEPFEIIKWKDVKYQLDPAGYFKIGVDHVNGRVLCEHKRPSGETHRLASDSADALMQEVLARGYITSLYHASYLGSELAKAEISIKLGHNYRQGQLWFTEQGQMPSRFTL